MAKYKEKQLTDENKNPISPIVGASTVYNGYSDTVLSLDTYLNVVVIDVSDERTQLDLTLDPRPTGVSGRFKINLAFSDPELVIITDKLSKLASEQYLLISLPPHKTDINNGVYSYYNGKKFRIIAACDYADRVKVNTDGLNSLVDGDITQTCVKSFLLTDHMKEFVCTSVGITSASEHWVEPNCGLERSSEITPTAISAILEDKVPSVSAVRKYVDERQTGVTQSQYNQMVASGRIDPSIIYIIKY